MKVIVSGIPRSGTTMVARAIAGLPPANTWPRTGVETVLKYHKPASDEFFSEARKAGFQRAVFVFGDVVSSVISTKRMRCDENHFHNCGCDKPIAKVDFFKRDDLNYERIFDTWVAPHGFPVLALRYDGLWDRQDMLSDFVGREVTLPPYRPRATRLDQVTPEELATICNTYATLIRKVELMPPALAIGGKGGGYE